MYGGEYKRPYPSVMIWRVEVSEEESTIVDMRQEDGWILKHVWREWLMPEKTDAEYADDLAAFLDNDRNTQIIVDPSAASFKAELRNRGFRVLDAKNDVREGIATTAVCISSRRIRAERNRCPALIGEVHSYVWDEKARMKGEERPVKVHDHAMDALRYLCHTKATRFRMAQISINN